MGAVPADRLRKGDKGCVTFTDALVAHGLRPRKVAADGKWYRCPTEDHPRKKNGSYKLAVDGRIGWFMNFASDSSPHTWRMDRVEKGEYDPSWLSKALDEQRKHLRDRTEAARRFYASCDVLSEPHPYLTRHGIEGGASGLRIDKKGWLVVPANRNGSLMSVQRISAEGDKRFWSGASVKGASFTIDRKNASLTVICEGLATGMAIHAATSEARVVVAFNAGNLRHMAKSSGMCVIAADNDWETEQRSGLNPGLHAAHESAEMLGCGVSYPTGIEGTDWSDWRQEMYRARLEMKRPREREQDIRRAVDAQLAMQIKRNAKFIA